MSTAVFCYIFIFIFFLIEIVSILNLQQNNLALHFLFSGLVCFTILYFLVWSWL